MKTWKKLVIAATSVIMAIGIAAVATACGVTGDDYTFEAEEGVLGGAAQKETGKHYWAGSIDEEGDELEQVGYMTTEGASITFTITAEKAAKVELNFRLASAVADQSELTTTGDYSDFMNMKYNGTYIIKGIDLEKQQVAKLTVNDSEVALKGKLEELRIPIEDMGPMEAMGVFYGAAMCNYQDVKVVVDLKEGENVIVFESTGYTEEVEVEGADPQQVQYGVNVDKLIIKSPVALTWEPTENTVQQGWGG